MISLYNLQTSLINAKGRNSRELQETFAQIRKPLKDEWEDLLFFLKKCCAFGDDTILLRDSLGRESMKDCVELVMDMASTSKELQKLSKTPLVNSKETAKVFAEKIPGFKIMLQQPVVRPPEDSGPPSDRMSNHW